MFGLSDDTLNHIVFVICALAFFQLCGRALFDCRLTEKSAVVFVFFFIPVYRMRYESITYVRRAILFDVLFCRYAALSFISQPFNKYVLIKKEGSGIYVSPRKAQVFIDALQARMRLTAKPGL